jgi:hypothetical protein
MAKAKPIPQLDIHAPNDKNARIIIKTRLEEMYSWDACVDNPERVQDLHNLRIAAKRLRYTLEMFEAILPEKNTSLCKEVEQIQAELGALHDSDVMIALLQLSLNSHNSETSDADVQPATSQELQTEKIAFHPDLLSCILDPAVAPSTQERQGLQLLLTSLQQERAEQYTAFRNHWYRLKKLDFQRQVLDMLAF